MEDSAWRFVSWKNKFLGLSASHASNMLLPQFLLTPTHSLEFGRGMLEHIGACNVNKSFMKLIKAFFYVEK